MVRINPLRKESLRQTLFSGKNQRFGCNMCKIDKPTYIFFGDDKNLWICGACLRKLLAGNEPLKLPTVNDGVSRRGER